MAKKKDKTNGIWSSKVGRDCVSLDTSLCRWLGKRLTHLATHTTSVPYHFTEQANIRVHPDMTQDHETWLHLWRHEMMHAGVALTIYVERIYEVEGAEAETIITHAQAALGWVAKWLPNLWD
jgi:hypothetical protein